MYLCFAQNLIGNFYSVQVATVGECSGFIAQSAVTFVEPSALDSLFKIYFQFDKLLFEQIVGWNLVVFVIGHCVGRVMMIARKT